MWAKRYKQELHDFKTAVRCISYVNYYGYASSLK
jgi:hypothetical protein